MPAPLPFRLLAYAMAGLLALSVALQYNDPDPLRWMLMYGAGVIASVLVASPRPIGGPFALIVGLVAAAWCLVLLRDVWGVVAVTDLTSKMSEKGGAVEVGREAGGLGIEAVWLLAAGAYRMRRP